MAVAPPWRRRQYMETARGSEPSKKSTETELEIMCVLWARGSCTVREVHELLYRDEGGGLSMAGQHRVRSCRD